MSLRLSLLLVSAVVVVACDGPPPDTEPKNEGEGEEGEGEGEGEEGEGEEGEGEEGEGEGEEGEGEGEEGEGEGEGDPGEGTVRGVVVEALTEGSVPVAGAIVAAGDVEVVTAVDGSFAIVVDAGVRVPLDVRGPPAGPRVLSSTQVLVDVRDGDVTDTVAELLPGCAATINVTDGAGGEGGTVTIAPRSCGFVDVVAGVILPAGGIVTEGGAPVRDVRVEMVPMPLVLGGRRSADAFLAFPGDLAAVDEDGANAFLESRGAVEVRLFDADSGAPAQLVPGRNATITFPASADAVVDERVRAWSYDEARALWVEEGEGVIDVDVATGTLVTRMTVPHFTWWNSDQVATRACFTGSVVAPDGTALAGARVYSSGVDYFGVAAATSGRDGAFRVPARRASQVELRGELIEAGAVARSTALSFDSGSDEDTCVNAGTVVIDPTITRACTRGVVVDEGGLPVAGLAVTLLSGRRSFAATSGADGSFCVTALPDVAFDVVVSGSVAGQPLSGSARGLAAGGSGTCSENGCFNLGNITARGRACVVGAVVENDGPIPGAVIGINGITTFTAIRTVQDGTFCAVVDRNDVVEVDAVATNLIGGRRYAGRGPHATTVDAGLCGAPATCSTVGDLVLDGEACVSGRAVDDDGVPLGGAVITSRPLGGGRTRTAVAANDGTFCVPAVADTGVELTYTKVTPGRRYFFAESRSTNAAAAVCGGPGCTQLGDVTLAGQTASSCIVGTARDGALPFQRNGVVSLEGVPFAALRPRDDGRYCIDVLAGSSTLTFLDPEPLPQCATLRETSAITVDATTSGSCADESTCIEADTFDFDFANFCRRS